MNDPDPEVSVPGQPDRVLAAAPMPPRRGLFGAFTLRWRLVIAFLLVGALPVLVASFIVASLVADIFDEKVEQWLANAAQFVTQQSADDQEETRQAAAIIAGRLNAGEQDLDSGMMEISGDLLLSVGYDAVAVYDDKGRILYSHGTVGDGAWLPRGKSSGFFVVSDKQTPVLLLGSVQPFERGGQTFYAFVGDRWDGTLVSMANSGPALNIQVFTVAAGKARLVQLSGAERARVPQPVLEQLSAGQSSLAANMFDSDHVASGFAALRDADGHLVGVVACRLSSQAPVYSHIRALQIFALLAALAGLISLGVALYLSKLISRPITRLTGALRSVHEGNYSTRVAVDGGLELAQLAAGFNDMTARLETLRQREAQLRRREKLAVLGEAAAVMAHEIRNPLGIIKASTQVLRMKTVSQARPEDKLIGFVLDEVGRIEKLVQELLDYARPKLIEHLPVDVCAELRGVLEFMGPELEARGIRLEADWPGQPARVMGDSAQLHQAFLNILLNARDAMSTGGSLSVAVTEEEALVSVSISDTGGGIAPEVQERLFEPFVTTKPRGTGLGLARVREVMEQHGGIVRFESVTGAGTRFILELPSLAGGDGEMS